MYIEKEMKYDLSKNEFERLKAYFSEISDLIKEKINENYYVKLSSKLYEYEKLSSKIRVIDNSKLKFILKIRSSEKNDEVTVKEEHTIDLTNYDLIHSLRNSNSSKLKMIVNSDAKIKEILKLKQLEIIEIFKEPLITVRTEYSIKNSNIIATFDCNTYLGFTDYELEFEISKFDESEIVIKKFLNSISNELKIELVSGNNSKFNRYFDMLDKYNATVE